MKIPSEFSSSPNFWRRLLQMANLLMIGFPRQEYDDDAVMLAQDLVQDTYARILAQQEPPVPIQNWPGYFYGVMRMIFFEKRREALKPAMAGQRRMRGKSVEDETEEVLPLEEMVPDQALRVDQFMELREEEEILAQQRRKLKTAVDEHLWQIIDEEIQKISSHPAFRSFVERCWIVGETTNAAWEFVKNSNPDGSRATYYRRYERLKVAVMKRWTVLTGDNVEGVM